MNTIRGSRFTADRAWGALEIANVHGVTTRLHWTDQAYPWHINDGDELFVVLHGVIDMHYRDAGEESMVTLQTGDIFVAASGSEHSARPRGESRVLVIEREGSA